MSDILNNQVVDNGIDPLAYEELKCIVASRVEDPVLLNEYIGAYAMVAQSLNMTIPLFVDLLRNLGGEFEQDAFLAGYLNQNRVANAKIGVLLELNTPFHVRREIKA
jgi:hypothetical protein